MSEPVFEILEHPADIGFRAFAATLPGLFVNAALAMLSIASDPEAVEARQEYPIAVASGDRESLLVDWLSEILYWHDGKRIAFRDFQIGEMLENRIEAVGCGEPRDPERHPARLIVKAVTWHQLRIEERGGLWTAQVYLDI